MKKVIDGVARFQQTAFEPQKKLFEGLAGGQKPLVLLITCSDSRIVPHLVTQTEPGEVFVLRNAGNIVPRYGAVDGGEAATIEYAVAALKIPDIVVCGHSHCGAMGGLLQPEGLGGLDAVRKWLDHADETARRVQEKHSGISDPKALLKAAVEENVLVQLENLGTHPSVSAAVSAGNLRLHGWTYTFETGDVLAYDQGGEQFLPLREVPDSVV